MKHHAFQSESVFEKLVMTMVAMLAVANYRVSDMVEMAAYLMLPPGFR